MNKKSLSPLELHVAGATVRHKSPFENLQTPVNLKELSIEVIEKWVKPFYRVNLAYSDKVFFNSILAIRNELSSEIVLQLLSDFNWRTRITGAYFSAIKNYTQLEDIIGVLLLKSEVCYAGTGYCLALMTFSTQKSIQYLKAYLDYYLNRKDLWFDQGDAMAALIWLDNQNHTNEAANYIDKWKSFIIDKPNWNLERSIDNFEKQLQTIFDIKELIKIS